MCLLAAKDGLEDMTNTGLNNLNFDCVTPLTSFPALLPHTGREWWGWGGERHGH